MAVSTEGNICRMLISKVLFVCILSIAVSTFTYIILYTYSNIKIFDPSISDINQSDSIHSFLAAVPHGHWVMFEPPRDRLTEVMSFIVYVRHFVYGMPRSLQRPDAKCGNTTITSSHSGNFRALCNPTGPTPCCYDNQCVDREEGQCACAQCVDARADDLHADFARFDMNHTGHQLTPFSSHPAICDVMSNVTLLFYGDSLVSHVYLALLTKTLGGNMTRLLAPHTPAAARETCQGQRMYVMACRRWMKDRWEFPNCDHPGKMSTFLAYKDVNKEHLKNTVRELSQKPNSVLYVGIGLHQDFNISFVNTTVLQAIQEGKGHSRCPYVIYAGIHHWGMLRNPEYVTTPEAAVEEFNRELKTLVSQYGMAYFDTYEMTRDMFSYDGTHYGYGVNQVKADILLNVIQKVKHQSMS